MKIPFFLITGFLGSGKTTLIKRFINEFAGNYKLAVIQNEFAPGNVDGTSLKLEDKPFKIMEVNKGSVFCVCLLSGFIKSLTAFIDQEKPDAILLEASGLADPVSIGELLQAPALEKKIYLAHVYCVVDAPHFLKKASGIQRVRHQVAVADTVIINKMDITDEIVETEDYIKKHNPYASIKKATYCDFDIKNVFEQINSKPVAIKTGDKLAQQKPGGRPDVQSAVLRTVKKVSKDQALKFVKIYAPQTIRLKGYILLESGGVLAVQSSFGDYNVSAIDDYPGNTEIIAMGEEVTPGAMKNILFNSTLTDFFL